jgi:hypothetical protein
MLKNLFAKGQSKIGFFVVGVKLDAFFGIFYGKSVILELNIGERSVGVVNG